jgi:hypothetical protein
MGAPDDGAPPARRLDDAAAPRQYGSTLSGCVGLVCVLALPALLFLPLDTLALPPWLARLVPLVGVGVAALGVWLVARVPAAPALRRADPLRPLTGDGRVPLREAPAERANRVSFAAASLLTALCVVGYLLASAAARNRDVLGGTLLSAAAGSALVVYSALVALRRLPPPALRWVRTPIRGGGGYPPVAFLLLGGVALVWALLVAFEAGYAWAAAGAALLTLLGALAGPIGQRLPPR